MSIGVNWNIRPLIIRSLVKWWIFSNRHATITSWSFRIEYSALHFVFSSGQTQSVQVLLMRWSWITRKSLFILSVVYIERNGWFSCRVRRGQLVQVGGTFLLLIKSDFNGFFLVFLYTWDWPWNFSIFLVRYLTVHRYSLLYYRKKKFFHYERNLSRSNKQLNIINFSNAVLHPYFNK